MSEAYHTIRMSTQMDGSVLADHETNDDNDDGAPDGEVSRWRVKWPTADKAKEAAGVSRVGVSGVVVTVWLDGQKL